MEDLSAIKDVPSLIFLEKYHIIIPTKEIIVAINKDIIDYRKKLGKNDPHSLRYEGHLDHLVEVLQHYSHRYTSDHLKNMLYVATETFYAIACNHPFTEGNKSTAYICALVLLHTNDLYAKNPTLEGFKVKFLDIAMSVPDEAAEIVKLADSSTTSEHEIKRLIKDFFAKYLQQK